MYRMGPRREDSFVFKWSMESRPVDLSLSGDRPYRADIWFWKAARTDHAGYADDKMHLYHVHQQKKAKKLLSKSGRIFYLRRMGDAGRAAYATVLHDQFSGPTVSQFIFRNPEGSRADVRAKGVWQEGLWTIEWRRKLKTGHPDDVSFELSGSYPFGVSIYEIAGRKEDPQSDKPRFGGGEVGESLTLIFR